MTRHDDPDTNLDLSALKREQDMRERCTCSECPSWCATTPTGLYQVSQDMARWVDPRCPVHGRDVKQHE
jgi:hypothetical protein